MAFITAGALSIPSRQTRSSVPITPTFRRTHFLPPCFRPAASVPAYTKLQTHTPRSAAPPPGDAPPPPIQTEPSESPPATEQEEQNHDKSELLRKDLVATLGWVGLAALSAAGIAKWKGIEYGLQFVTAYIVEYSLSIDNLFVFLLIFRYFQVSRTAQTRVLSYGIAGAVFFRLIMIVAGEALTHQFKGVTLAFAAILIFSAIKIFASEQAEEDDDVGQSGVVKFASRLLPFTDSFDGDKFFTNINGKNIATPLMLVLLSVEFSDVIFALDSVPAVLGISDDTLVIYLSNVMAIAGLRNLFFLLADSIEGLRFLPQALAIVLGFVGSKMTASVFGYDIGIVQSLTIVISALAGGVGLSLLFPEENVEEAATPK